jgi:hypothetical protein
MESQVAVLNVAATAAVIPALVNAVSTGTIIPRAAFTRASSPERLSMAEKVVREGSFFMVDNTVAGAAAGLSVFLQLLSVKSEVPAKSKIPAINFFIS